MTAPHHEDAKMESKFYTHKKTNYRTKREKNKNNSNSPFILPRIYDRAAKKNNTLKFNTNTEATIAHKQNLNLNQLNGTNEMLRMEINEKA